MIAPLRKTLASLPIIYSLLHSDNSIRGFLQMLFGGMFLWIPYWLAWWLSDGFSNIEWSSNFDYRANEIYGLNNGGNFEYLLRNDESGYRTGPQGFGLYSGSTRIDI